MTYRTVGNGDKAPPGVSRPFVAIDDGNCSPRFLRATTYYVPQTREAAGLAKLPLSLICRPMALPVEGEVRLRRPRQPGRQTEALRSPALPLRDLTVRC